jgi:hypothetical protein
MPYLDPAFSYALALLNVIVYAGLAYQLLWKQKKKARALTMADAFKELGAALLAAVPGLPKGFTLREGVEKAKSLGIVADWGKVGGALRAYESMRYGSEPDPAADFSEVISLAESLEEAAPR